MDSKQQYFASKDVSEFSALMWEIEFVNINLKASLEV
jgi:hypothetical protein